MSFSKFVIVTGASTGIGRSIAVSFAKDGVFVALVGRNEEKLIETNKIIAQNKGQSKIFIADFTKIDSVNSLISSIKKETNKIDILVNVAGVWHGNDEVYANKDFESFSEDVILDTYSVGLTTPTLLCHSFISLMEKGSLIINLSGTFEDGAKGWLPYYVSKRAMEDLTVALSEELKDKGIKVNCVSPSDTATEQYKRFFPEYINEAQSPEDVAKLFLEISKKDVTGKVFMIKKRVVKEGFHR